MPRLIIDKGHVINNYDAILKKMKDEKLIGIDGYMLRPFANPKIEPPKDIVNFIEAIIDKYSKLSRDELISLSHTTDSYKITTNDEKEMGKIINKNLANLESFFCDNDSQKIAEKNLPKEYMEIFDKKN